MKKTGAVLVAAGMSSRMHDFKPMMPFGDSTISMHMTEMLTDPSLHLDPVVVVTGYQAAKLEGHLSHTGVRFVRNVRFNCSQMFDSVVLGIQSIFNECQRVAILPMDIPAILPETISQALKIDAEMVRTSYHGEPGHPIVLTKAAAEKICTYEGEGGLRGAMEHVDIPITNLEVEDPGVRKDVDTKEEYQEMLDLVYHRGEGYPITPQIKVRLKAYSPFFGPGTCELLEWIKKTGSIQDACLQMNLSYSKGSKMIKNMDRQLGFPVVERKSGGAGGGGSVLTQAGARLLANYKAMVAELEKETEKVYQKYFEKGFRN